MPLPLNFQGFPEPKYTRVPNLIFDCVLAEFSESRLKVLLFIVRKTMGWQKDHDFTPIAVSQIETGTGLSKPSVIDSIQFLVENNLIIQRKQRDSRGRAAASEYRLRFESDAVDETPANVNDPNVGDPKVKNPNVGNFGVNLYLGEAPVISVFKEREIQVLPPSPPQENSPLKNLQHPCDYQTPAELAETLSNLRRHTKAGRIKGKELTDLRERIPGLLSKAAPDEIVAAFEAFTQDEYWQERNLPVYGFINQVDRYLQKIPPPSRSAAQPATAATPEDVPGRTPPAEPVAGLQIANPLPAAAQEWNRVVTAGPAVEEWTKRDRGLDAAVADPDFLAALPKVLPVCQKAFEVQPEEVGWLSFRWLLKKGKSGAENWYAIASGDMNWLRTKRSAGGKQKVDPFASIRKELGIA